MKRFSPLWAIVLLVLFSNFTVVSPAAAEPRSESALSFLATGLEHLWSLIPKFWIKNGCGLDPSGACAQAVSTKNGCGIDPDGVRRCEPPAPATTENGCGIDPDGNCRQY